MKAYSLLFLYFLLPYVALADGKQSQHQDYTYYHRQVIEAEKLIADEKYQEALKIYDSLFATYDFIFLREYQIATQLALHLKDVQKALHYLKMGIARGWNLKSIRKNDYLSTLRKTPEWKSIRKEYRALKKHYQQNLASSIRKQVKKMFFRDQWKALGALFTFSPLRQDRYAEKKFAPHSERQLARLISLLKDKGYPGEKIIGNNFWIATILAHHNSISKPYVEKDTLYAFLKPKLLMAISKGQMSPKEFALVDDWHLAVKLNHQATGYGYLNSPARTELVEVNALRQKIGLGAVEIHNRLIDLEKQTGMNFYLPGRPWIQDKILIKEKR